MAGCLADLTSENLAIDLELSVGAVHPLPPLYARYISTIIFTYSRLFTKSKLYTNIPIYKYICFAYQLFEYII